MKIQAINYQLGVPTLNGSCRFTADVLLEQPDDKATGKKAVTKAMNSLEHYLEQHFSPALKERSESCAVSAIDVSECRFIFTAKIVAQDIPETQSQLRIHIDSWKDEWNKPEKEEQPKTTVKPTGHIEIRPSGFVLRFLELQAQSQMLQTELLIQELHSSEEGLKKLHEKQGELIGEIVVFRQELIADYETAQETDNAE